MNTKTVMTYYTTHLPEWLKLKTITIQHIGTMQRNEGSHTLLVGRKTGTTSFEKHLAARTKAKLFLPYEHASLIPVLSTKKRTSTYGHQKTSRHP